MKNDKPSYSQLEKENKELRANQHAIANEFRSSLDDVVRAQFSVECIIQLLNQINPQILHDYDDGKHGFRSGDLESIKNQIRKLQHAIRLEWSHLNPSKRRRENPGEIIARAIIELTEDKNENLP